jgi:hypothetical protein
MANVGVSKNNKCGEKNIHFAKNRWIVQIMRRGVSVCERFTNIEDAKKFRDDFFNK